MTGVLPSQNQNPVIEDPSVPKYKVKIESKEDIRCHGWIQVKVRELIPEGQPPPYRFPNLKGALEKALAKRLKSSSADRVKSIVKKMMIFKCVKQFLSYDDDINLSIL